MTETTEGTLLWEPSPEFRESAAITRYKEWIATEKDLPFEDYTALWEWSVTDLEGFWSSLWEFFDVQSSKPYEAVLGRREMPGAEWFPGAELNSAEHVFRNAHSDGPALGHASQRPPPGRPRGGPGGRAQLRRARPPQRPFRRAGPGPRLRAAPARGDLLAGARGQCGR